VGSVSPILIVDKLSTEHVSAIVPLLDSPFLSPIVSRKTPSFEKALSVHEAALEPGSGPTDNVLQAALNVLHVIAQEPGNDEKRGEVVFVWTEWVGVVDTLAMPRRCNNMGL